LELGLKKLKPFLEQTDILSLNSEEAQQLGGLSAVGDLPRSAFLLTEGSKGALVRAAGKNLRAHSLKKKLINTTGAGDAFSSGFVAAWIKTKHDLRASLAVAMLNATGVITHMGAKAGILPRFPNKNECKRVNIR
jgi:sugar/nucleoside kinase (ribokinase family)